ncbi:hypothetical protein, partial [Arthrobacter sp. STN4]|uniref:hypothetical protein n=1 Tax=Arthrobacter sp. STN4 TaxID=2923276 RepID=UPI00211A8F9B
VDDHRHHHHQPQPRHQARTRGTTETHEFSTPTGAAQPPTRWVETGGFNMREAYSTHSGTER